jgi:hypothetical protein
MHGECQHAGRDEGGTLVLWSLPRPARLDCLFAMLVYNLHNAGHVVFGRGLSLAQRGRFVPRRLAIDCHSTS